MQEGREWEFVTQSLSAQTSSNGEWLQQNRGKEREEGYRLQHQVEKNFGTLPTTELSVTVSAVFQSKFSNTACSDLFIYLIYATCPH